MKDTSENKSKNRQKESHCKNKKNRYDDKAIYTRSKMEPGFQIAAGSYSSYVTRAIWKDIRSRFHFGMGIITLVR